MKTIDWKKEYPGIEFYEIQKKIITDDLLWTGVFLGTGVGKTLTCLAMAEGKTLVICPKQQMLDRTWQKNNEKFNLGKDLTVINYDMFWRKVEDYGQYDTVILDECHRALGVETNTRQRKGVIIPKASKTFEAIFEFLRQYPPKRFYMASATAVTKPMNLWALAKIFKKDWDYYKFRETFYFPIMKGRRQLWKAKTDDATTSRLALNVLKFGYTGALKDFADVPEQTHKEVIVELTAPQKQALKQLEHDEADPLVRMGKKRTIENGVLYGKKIETINEKEDRLVKDATIFPSKKIDYILERAIEFDKLLVFVAYTAQVEAVAKALREEGHKVYTVTGQTKDRATVFEDAEADKKCTVVAQASICEGYRIPSIPCTIFASKSYRYVHYEQALGRTIDGQHLEKKLYIHLIVKGGADENCHNAIMRGSDFQEKLSVL